MFLCTAFLFGAVLCCELQAQDRTSKTMDLALENVERLFSIYQNDTSRNAFDHFMDSTSAIFNHWIHTGNIIDVAQLYESGIALGRRNGDGKIELKFAVLLGNYYRIKGDFVRSNEVLKSALNAEGLNYDKVQQYLLIASNYFQIDLSQSLQYLDEAEKRIGSIEDMPTVMLYHNNRAEYFRRANDLIAHCSNLRRTWMYAKKPLSLTT
jgi:tetratricopeptide (TPR) repeat protein